PTSTSYPLSLHDALPICPTDVWVPSSNIVKPQIADQIALGYYHNLKNNAITISSEIYYKHMQNQIDYRNGAQTVLNDLVEGELVDRKSTRLNSSHVKISY